jgi:hypothetical protein
VPALVSDCGSTSASASSNRGSSPQPPAREAGKGWAALIKQVYETDPLCCPPCKSGFQPQAFLRCLLFKPTCRLSQTSPPPHVGGLGVPQAVGDVQLDGSALGLGHPGLGRPMVGREEKSLLWVNLPRRRSNSATAWGMVWTGLFSLSNQRHPGCFLLPGDRVFHREAGIESFPALPQSANVLLAPVLYLCESLPKRLTELGAGIAWGFIGLQYRSSSQSLSCFAAM